MGYVTWFTENLIFDRPLAPHHLAYLQAYSRVPHVHWDVDIVKNDPDPLREAVGLPIGENGCYFTGRGLKDLYVAPPWVYLAGANEATIDPAYIDWICPGVPYHHCAWRPGDDGTELRIASDKPYCWYTWLQYLLDHFLVPWGYILNGKMTWQGEDEKDRGALLVEKNRAVARRDEQLSK
ncbi:hypothetical protein [Dictyobacter formicarum]|nr:hypothetical protein [Dictyobacter formicarum]